MIDLQPIDTPEAHAWGLRELEAYFGREPTPGTPEAFRFDMLALLVERYEEAHFPIEASDPIELLQFAIEDMGRTRAELNALIGQPHASEVLARRRPLSLKQIRVISAAWHLPVNLLVPEYATEKRAA